MDYFILSGSTSRGDQYSPNDRAAVIDLWLEEATPDRLLACCWVPEDIEHAVARSITPMAVLTAASTADSIAFLRGLPRGSTIYSHPMFGGATFDAELAQRAQALDIVPAGGKLAKVTVDEIPAIRSATNSRFRLWDGSSRHIAASLAAGAAGVVATPLSAFSTAMPEKEIGTIQAVVDSMQTTLDGLRDRSARSDFLIREATL
ncbi:hypothetical protein JK358_34220 [Nocardia sp. 2]|uniref:Uncharacterized protein n=1 Tax=Nocardia acididurans TaxID=2802282 RepID=A0ABS1MGT3_9NOCA|nr:hypothetical protein [Nocardia acididurans]MBL1079474.1 hypothetical protein [Nocardia acididurans]